MKKAILAVALLFAASTSSQEKPFTLDSLIETSSALAFSTPHGVILTCSGVAGFSYSIDDVYDCKLAQGATLDGLVRFWMGVQRQQAEAVRLDHEQNQKFLSDTLRRLDKIQKELQRSIPRDKKSKS